MALTLKADDVLLERTDGSLMNVVMDLFTANANHGVLDHVFEQRHGPADTLVVVMERCCWGGIKDYYLETFDAWHREATTPLSKWHFKAACLHELRNDDVGCEDLKACDWVSPFLRKTFELVTPDEPLPTLRNVLSVFRPVQTLFYLEVVWLSGCLVVVCPSVTRWEGSPCSISSCFTVSRHRSYSPDDTNSPLARTFDGVRALRVRALRVRALRVRALRVRALRVRALRVRAPTRL